MTPQERDLITQLLDRLKQAGTGQPKDREAEQLIGQAVARQPDAPYYLVQTVLIQDMALANAQHRIAALEQQLEAAQRAEPQQQASFLGSLLGRGASPQAAPASGPWTRPAPAPAYQPQYQAPQSSPGAGPWGGQPMAQAVPMMASGGSGFLRQAATTAVGIAGGALLFEGIQSMFGSHAGGILANATMQPSISETVINNYYGDDPGRAPRQETAWDDRSGSDPASDYTADQSAPSDQDYASNQDFGGSDDDLV